MSDTSEIDVNYCSHHAESAEANTSGFSRTKISFSLRSLVPLLSVSKELLGTV
jgi:hypothetical protein